jgi:hypothetical protein
LEPGREDTYDELVFVHLLGAGEQGESEGREEEGQPGRRRHGDKTSLAHAPNAISPVLELASYPLARTVALFPLKVSELAVRLDRGAPSVYIAPGASRRPQAFVTHSIWLVGRLGFELFDFSMAESLLLAITRSFQAVSVCSFIQLCRWFGAPTGLPPVGVASSLNTRQRFVHA